MDKYAEIKEKLLETAKQDEHMKTVIMIGSSTRTITKADEYSDLDLIIATDDTDSWLYGDIPSQLGNLKISFVEPTLGGGKERRVLYDGCLDVDMIIFTKEQLVNAIHTGAANEVMNRGYSVLYDSMGIIELLKDNIVAEVPAAELSEAEYLNMVNDFYFHIIWVAKKLLRGELWSAKMCLDAYLKNYLLKMLEVYTVGRYHTDVWHDGRFLDRWAEEDVRQKLKECFAHYDKEDMWKALTATEELFTGLARETAQMKGYSYPAEAEKTAECFLKEKYSAICKQLYDS